MLWWFYSVNVRECLYLNAAFKTTVIGMNDFKALVFYSHREFLMLTILSKPC